ncbi:MAG: excalibur calcium-binding domain-containing protein [Hyphomicrobiales bacterium]|nr:excalibur calcium-binding domain-containing protein [Hyphomicrobiales bacterium]
MSRLAAIVWVAGMATSVVVGSGSAIAFDCARTQCPQISTCAEARYKLYVCGHSERDADNDGIPCESLCGKDLATFEARSLATWPKGLPFAAVPKRQDVLELIPPARADPVAPSGLVCEGKRRCGQMNSCEEAQFYLRTCGVTSLDRDGDGTACNSLCGGR